MSMRIYSNGARIVGVESVIGYDLENPMNFWLEGINKPIYILSELDEFTRGRVDAYDDAASLIEDMPGFSGCTYCMGPDNMRAYIDKHFFTIPFSKGEHGLSYYHMGTSYGWDCGTAGYFLLPRDSWTAVDANSFSLDCNHLMQSMTAWANGDEYAVHELYIKNGSLYDECCYGFYGEDDALSDACIENYAYLGAFNHDDVETAADDDNPIMAALIDKFPDNFKIVEHVDHVPEKIVVIPAHDEAWTEFVQIS